LLTSAIREGFWRRYQFTTLDQANSDVREWLTRKEDRIHGTTHERILDRARREQPLLSPCPAVDVDTSARLYRKVAKDCTIHLNGNRYVVDHRLVGQTVIVRLKDEQIRIFADTVLVVTYKVPPSKGNLVQDPRFYEALRRDRQMNKRKYGAVVRSKGRAIRTISPRVTPNLDIPIRSAAFYDQFLRDAGVEVPQ